MSEFDDSALLHLCVDVCRHRRTVVDAGADIGDWSLRLMHHFDHVVVFEPVEYHYHCLSKVLNGPLAQGTRSTTQLINKTLSHDSKPVRYGKYTPPPILSWKTIKGLFGHDIDPRPMVRAATLDSYELHDVDLIRFDLHSSMYGALFGAMQTIGRNKPAILIRSHKDDSLQIRTLLRITGMRLEYMDEQYRLFVW